MAAITMANTSATKATKVDSVRNCLIKPDLLLPNVLRTPTSFALFRDRAVDRFIKLTQARMIKNRPTAASIYTF